MALFGFPYRHTLKHYLNTLKVLPQLRKAARNYPSGEDCDVYPWYLRPLIGQFWCFRWSYIDVLRPWFGWSAYKETDKEREFSLCTWYTNDILPRKNESPLELLVSWSPAYLTMWSVIYFSFTQVRTRGGICLCCQDFRKEKERERRNRREIDVCRGKIHVREYIHIYI
jgi:hypothetical protein